MDNFKEALNAYADKISKTLTILTDEYLDMSSEAAIVSKAMDYSLNAGGKRLRPLLTIEFYKLFGGKEDITKIACAVELIHTFSLIHDDLPCMDDDDYRRGKKSCHKQFDEATALLAGDALAVLPYEIISDKALKGEITHKAALKLIRNFSNATGVFGMIGGQVLDMQGENKSLGFDDLMLLQSKKTGALIESACVAGCILADADEEKINNARAFAHNLGVAFQVCDDILDITGTFEELGKPIGSDSVQGKSTFATLLGVDKAKEYARKLTDKAVEAISEYEGNEFLTTLALSLIDRKN